MSKYGRPEDVARRHSPAAREERYTAILRLLAAHDQPLSPNQIGEAINADGIEVPRTHGHSGKLLGRGSAISPTLEAMKRRGWIARWPRPDGLSGGARIITRAGLDELKRREAP